MSKDATDKDGTAIPDDERRAIISTFHDLVNMTPSALEHWLETDTSREVGWAQGTNKTEPGGPESVGHKEGRRIVMLLRRRQAELDADDIANMRKVTGYVKRHLAQRPSGDVTDTRWRHSLMNWGHDPLR